MTDPGEDQVTLTIDGREVSVPAGTLIIRAAERLGVQIPRFCDHPLLDPVGACRQCIVDVQGAPKPVTSCTTPVAADMVVRTQVTSEVADKAQRGVMELLLINHPLDCPVCDKGGECPLQNQALASGHARSRFTEVKRTFPKPLAISSQVLLDRERCVMCARCTRFSDQIAGDSFVDLFERGALQQVGVYGDAPFESYFSGNTVQICPVGALTGAAYRFRARPFDLVSSPAVCEHCASGCGQRTDHRRGTVLRRLAGDDPDVNEEWNCDKGRWAFTYARQRDRLSTPMIRGEGGGLVPVSWSTALAAAAAGLTAARGRTGVLTGGRLTVEDAYAYAKFARVVLGTNDVDFRARGHIAEEAEFLASRVVGRTPADGNTRAADPPGAPAAATGGAEAPTAAPAGGAVTYANLETAPVVLLVGFDPEEESPIVFLRLRRAVRDRGLPVFSIAPFASPAVRKTDATLLLTVPGTEPQVLGALAAADADHDVLPALLREPGAVIMVGERLGAIPGALTAAGALADATGARLAWVPRRAGERGALESGCLPGLLPGGRPVYDDDARSALAELWRCPDLPSAAGRSTSEQLAAATDGQLGALLIAGVEAADLPDPDAALAAVDAAGFVVSIELRRSEITDRADVVLPIAPVAEKAGTFVNWEGRARPFAAALTGTEAMPDHRVLNAIAEEAGIWFGLPEVESVRRELDAVRAALPPADARADARPDAARSQPHAAMASRPDHSTRETPSTGAAAADEAGARADDQAEARASGAHVAGARADAPAGGARGVSGAGRAVLATWRMLLDSGRMQDGEPHLAGTARRPVARLSPATAAGLGIRGGDPVTVSTARGAITLPLAVTEMPDGVVWIPQNSPGSAVGPTLGAAAGDPVDIAAAPAEVTS